VGIDIDTENKVERSIVMEGKWNGVEVSTPLKSVGRVAGKEISVRVSGREVGSPDVSGRVSCVPTLDGNPSVSVWVSVGSGLISKVVRKNGVDVEKSVGVSGKEVGNTLSSVFESRGIMSVKLKGGELRKTVSNSMISSSLMAGVGEPRWQRAGDGRWALWHLQRVRVQKGGSSSVQPGSLFLHHGTTLAHS